MIENYASQTVKNNKFEILLYLKQVSLLMRNKTNILRALNQIYDLIQVIQSDILSKSKLSKSLNKKRKKLNETNSKTNNNDNKVNENYYDDHADNFLNLINSNNGNSSTEDKKTKPQRSYSSSFAPKKLEKT